MSNTTYKYKYKQVTTGSGWLFHSFSLGVSLVTEEHLPPTAREQEPLGLQIKEYA